MKILYVNFLHNMWGHKRLDESLIEYLATFAQVTVISPTDWYENIPSNVRMIYFEPTSIFKNNHGIEYHYLSLKMMRFAAKLDQKEHFDYIFAASFNTYVVALGLHFFRNKKRIYIMHHHNTDSLDRKKLNFFFKSYVNKVKHIVFEEFIANYLIEKYKLSNNNVLVLPHPLYYNRCENVSKEFSCVGISNHNDEELISNIISIEKESGILKKNNCSVILKSESQTFDDGYLKVITGYLETDKYNYYINGAFSLFIPFPKSYVYRMSGTLMDALSNNIILIGSDIPLVNVYASKYPHLCCVIKNVDEFFNRILSIKKYNSIAVQEEFEEFTMEHSRQRIVDKLKNEFIEK